MSVKNIFLLLSLLFALSSNADDHPRGHLKPLGSQIPPIGDILVLNEVPPPQEFFDKFVKPGQPVLFKGAASNTPAYELWTDDYLSSKFGKEMFDVEEGKKENRSKELFNMPLDQYLKSYQEKDMYLVTTLPKIMRDDIYLLKCLLCGGFTDELQDSVMWFSNGGTKSVLHFDAIDNINCLMSGTKDLFMVDKREHAHVDIDKPEGSFCNVDVDKVDLYKYPGLADVPWYKARMEPGDCLFIPYRWFHQVRSYGPRNLAINIWFAHRLKFNTTDCEYSPYRDKEFAPLSAFRVLENLEPSLGLLVTDEMEEKPVDEVKWLEIMKRLWSKEMVMTAQGIEALHDIFTKLDTNKDSLVSPEEVMQSSLKEHEKRLAELFDDVDEGEEDGEEGSAEEEDVGDDETPRHEDL